MTSIHCLPCLCNSMLMLCNYLSSWTWVLDCHQHLVIYIVGNVTFQVLVIFMTANEIYISFVGIFLIKIFKKYMIQLCSYQIEIIWLNVLMRSYAEHLWKWAVQIYCPRLLIAESFWQWTDLEYQPFHIFSQNTECDAATQSNSNYINRIHFCASSNNWKYCEIIPSTQSMRFHSDLMKYHFSVIAGKVWLQHNRMTLRDKGEIITSSVRAHFFYLFELYHVDECLIWIQLWLVGHGQKIFT